MRQMSGLNEKIMNKSLDSIFLYIIDGLSIPEGVLVMTVTLMGWMWRLRVW